MTKLSDITGGSGVTAYTNISQLPLTHSAGDMAYVDSSDRLYVSNGSGWYSIAVTNATPRFGTSPNATYMLDSNGGTATTLNLSATDSDDNPLFWTFTADDSADDLATITNDSNGTFTITAKSLNDILTAGYDSEGGSFDVTFKVSDNISFANATSEFTITFINVPQWEISSILGASSDSTNRGIVSLDGTPSDLQFNDDGTKSFMTGLSTGNIFEMTHVTAWSLTGSFTSTTHTFGSLYGFRFSPDGLYLLTMSNGGVVTTYSLSTAWDITTKSTVGSSSALIGASSCQGFDVSYDGMKIYTVGQNQALVREYSFSTAWDATTISTPLDQSYNMGSNVGGNSWGIRFNPKGTQFFIGDNTSDRIHQFDLTTAWDVSTASYITEFNPGASGPLGLTFKDDDGTKMYIADNGSNNLMQFSTGL